MFHQQLAEGSANNIGGARRRLYLGDSSRPVWCSQSNTSCTTIWPMPWVANMFQTAAHGANFPVYSCFVPLWLPLCRLLNIRRHLLSWEYNYLATSPTRPSLPTSTRQGSQMSNELPTILIGLIFDVHLQLKPVCLSFLGVLGRRSRRDWYADASNNPLSNLML